MKGFIRSLIVAKTLAEMQTILSSRGTGTIDAMPIPAGESGIAMRAAAIFKEGQLNAEQAE